MPGILRALVALAVVLLGGCALTKFEAPQLSVTNVTVTGGDLWQQHLTVHVHVVNPNERALPVERIVYRLEVEGQECATGESASAFVVPPLGQADFDMNVNTNLAATALKVLGKGTPVKSLDYRLRGKVSLSEGFLRSIPFDQSGTFKLQ
ncbi:MAG TPA: LEA type 2 family protein [Steroidobacteraceae bacterium]|nr:LEA type 2 family protein [Steroidobacteraceae bacterium]